MKTHKIVLVHWVDDYDDLEDAGKIILYNMTTGFQEKFDLNQFFPKWKSQRHFWPSVKAIEKANAGKTATILDTWIQAA